MTLVYVKQLQLCSNVAIRKFRQWTLRKKLINSNIYTFIHFYICLFIYAQQLFLTFFISLF